ncbi:MAG: CoA-binding protein [Candidatus Nanoarchaeia archaeon]
MKELIQPKTIAVIGASNKKSKVGYSLMENLKRFKGEVIPINIHEKKILGKKSYKSILFVEKNIDLAIIAIPAAFVKQTIKECRQKGVKAVIVISAGFSEAGRKDMETELMKEKGSMRVLGPNCFGVVNPYIGLDTTFAKTTPKKGDVAFISQSGALWSAIAEHSVKENFGFSGFVSLGNMMDIGFEDALQYFENDSRTRIIVLYIETLKDGRKLMKIAKKCKKKIIAIKAGTSEAGIKAALSHTGSMAGSYEVYKAAFKQAGIILADSLTEAFDKAKYGINEERKALIITNAGGPGTLMADYCEQNKVEVVKLPRIKFALPTAWSHRNPIDVIGDAKSDRFKEVFKKIARKNFYDLAIIVLTPQKMTDVKNVAREVVRFKKKSKKKVVACWMTEEGREILENGKIPTFSEPKRVAEYLRM